jgi:pyruvate/2-oxoglutarate dehydrogenase complex dihydrolipoamide dehydrogenase (E3) component
VARDRTGVKNLTELPKSMVVLGAGVIGCEFATIFSNLGKTKVFLIDKKDFRVPQSLFQTWILRVENKSNHLLLVW